MQRIARTEVEGQQATDIVATGNEIRRYYLPHKEPLEIVETVLPPRHTQPFHRHRSIREAILVDPSAAPNNKPLVRAIQRNGVRTTRHDLYPGDLVVFDPGSCHTIENLSDVELRVFGLKFVGLSKDAELFATDKESPCDAAYDEHPAKDNAMDPRVPAYVALYNSLDIILWGIPTAILAGSVVLLGFFGNALANPSLMFPGLTHDRTIAALAGIMGLFYVMAGYAMLRIRLHHTQAGQVLAKMGAGEYFEKRVRDWRDSVKAAPTWFILLFWGLAALLFTTSFALWAKG